MNGFGRLSRRGFLGTMASAGTLSATGCGQGKKAGPVRKHGIALKDVETGTPNGMNLIVIIADTFRWDHLGYNGNIRVKTPNLDALASAGTYFENCYADGLPTIPSRRVMHTGMSILPDKVKWRPLESDDITLAEILGKAGFTTGFVVDTYHHFKPGMNFHRGFDTWTWIRGQEADPYKSGPEGMYTPEEHAPEHLLRDQFRERMNQYLMNTTGRESEDDYFCAKSCSAAARWLAENKDNDGPFMLFIDMFDPHEPWDAPPRFKKMYRESYPYERYIFGYGVDPDEVREDDLPVLRDLYAAEVTFSDYCIGGLIEEVKRLGLWDNTIIAFSTDHGTHLGEQGCVQKQAKLLNSCIARVPLIIRHPDSTTHGTRIAPLASHLDFTPTFLGMLGVDTNLDFDGRNMWDLVTGSAEKLRDYAVTGYSNFGSVHTPDWHYYRNVWGNNPGLGPQLYDLKTDPLEERDVADANPKVTAKMDSILDASFT